MRKALVLLFLTTACTTAPPAPPPVTSPAAPHGLTVEEDARVLAMEDRRLFDPLVVSTWVTHPNTLHRARIALALGRIGGHVFVDANGNGQRDAGEGQAGVTELTVLAGDPDANVRTNAAFALGEIGDAGGANALFTLAADANSTVATEAVEALSKMSAQVPFARYAPLTATGPEGVRTRAIRFLFRYNTDEASAVAAALLDASEPKVREEAAFALSRRAYAPARAKLELLANDADTMTRAHAVAALGRIGSGESMPAIIRALGDIHPWVRTNAAVAGARIAAASTNAGLVSDDLPRILAMTEDPDPGTRASGVDLLGYYSTRYEAARTRLLGMLANGTRWERELAAAAIVKHFGETNLGMLPADISSWAKVRALEAAATLPKSGPVLRRRFAADPDTMVRTNAIASIPDAAVDAEMSIIRAALDDSDPIIRANALDRFALSPSVSAGEKIQIFTAAEERARNDKENDARLTSIRALADLTDFNREPFLRALLADNDAVVRRAAADLIEQILKLPRPQYTPLPETRTPAQYQEIASWARQPHTATIHMTRGVIELALLTQDAPMTTWNFAELARKKYFDNTTFMRVVPNFVIQGGDPRNDQNGGPGYSIRDEINLQKYTRGAMGMALSGPDTGGSQFFITHSPQPHLDGGYTIFARVYSGMTGVVDQTERGDRVETITIDERAPAAAADLESVQQTSLPLVIGPTTADRLIAMVPDYATRKADYQPDDTVVEMIAAAVQPGDHIDVYMGTWCPDSLREVPRFLKIADVMKEKYGKEVPVTMVALDRSKTQPADLIAGKAITKVATFIYYRGDEELGRIEEKPTVVFEDDLLAIVSRPAS